MVKIGKQTITDYAKILLGVTLMAAAVTVFFEPNKLITGGASGLAIIISSYAADVFSLNIPISVLTMAINLPLLIVGFKVLGKNFIWRTFVATALFSAALAAFEFLPGYEGDYVIVAVFGGVLMGAGIGLALSSYSTTGGSDLLASILNKLNGNISVANAIFIEDAAVIALGLLLFGVERGLYAIVSVFISSKVIDGVLEGLNFSKGAFIISEKSAEIAEDVMLTLKRGVTGLSGKGMYTENELNVLLCVVAKKEIVTLKSIVKNHDPKAFLIISDVRETLGEGFGREERK